MVCFCHATPLLPAALFQHADPANAGSPPGEGASPPGNPAVLLDPVLPALHRWLVARWLPAPAFLPDPAWKDVSLAKPLLTATALSTISTLIEAADRCRKSLGIDLMTAAGPKQLARAVSTLDARLSDSAQSLPNMAQAQQVLQALEQVQAAERAISSGMFDEGPEKPGAADVPIGPWRPLLSSVMALAPLIALGRHLALDWSDPAAVDALAGQLRTLAGIKLPPISDQAQLLEALAQADAVSRLRAGLGTTDVLAARSMVQDRAEAAMAALPPTVRAATTGELVGMPSLPPNPSLLLNKATLQLAETLTPDVLGRMRWQVPQSTELSLITSGLPVASLAGCLAQLGASPPRPTPCAHCDAGRLTGDGRSGQP